jgi:hypothetical protein
MFAARSRSGASRFVPTECSVAVKAASASFLLLVVCCVCWVCGWVWVWIRLRGGVHGCLFRILYDFVDYDLWRDDVDSLFRVSSPLCIFEIWLLIYESCKQKIDPTRHMSSLLVSVPRLELWRFVDQYLYFEDWSFWSLGFSCLVEGDLCLTCFSNTGMLGLITQID